MTRNLTFTAADRLLVFAPHPDDETLATGELIQLAVAAGAGVHVVFATDGDNNPWPQRWFERRLHIGDADRARWGARRRSEAQAALARLGVGADATRFLGWPDLGLTRKLIGEDAAIDVLGAEVSALAPTHVAVPSLRDRHPDHGALRVMLDLALVKTRFRCVRLGYVVHGRGTDPRDWSLAPQAARHQRKRDALLAHESQISLSRRRLLRWAEQAESFEQAEPEAPVAMHSASVDSVLRIPLLPAHRFWRQHDLLLVLGGKDTLDRVRLRLPRLIRPAATSTLAEGLCAGRVTVELIKGILQITFAGGASGYIKLERSWPRVVIFDATTWHRLEDFPMLRGAAAEQAKALRVPQRAST
jgi:LmbE family N-acetylglucosaminyl deacetylase